MNMCKNGKIVLRGVRNKQDGLWGILLSPTLIEDNYTTKPTHAALYGSTKRNIYYNMPNYTRAIEPLIKDYVNKHHTKTSIQKDL